jgi:hypothetical protein
MGTLTTRAYGYTLLVYTCRGAGLWELLDGERLVAFSEDWLRVDRAIRAGVETAARL